MPDPPKRIAIRLREAIEDRVPQVNIAVTFRLPGVFFGYGSMDISGDVTERVQLGFDRDREMLLRDIAKLESMIFHRSILVSVFLWVGAIIIWAIIAYLLHHEPEKRDAWCWISEIFWALIVLDALFDIVRYHCAGTELKGVLEAIKNKVMNREVVYPRDLEGLCMWYWDYTLWKAPEDGGVDVLDV